MRKLLHAIFGMFKHQQPFQGARLFALPGELLLHPTDLPSGGSMRSLKRKVSCTFKREIPLEIQERIYPLPWRLSGGMSAPHPFLVIMRSD